MHQPPRRPQSVDLDSRSPYQSWQLERDSRRNRVRGYETICLSLNDQECDEMRLRDRPNPQENAKSNRLANSVRARDLECLPAHSAIRTLDEE